MPFFSNQSNVVSLSIDAFIAPATTQKPTQITALSCKIQLKVEEPSIMILPFPSNPRVSGHKTAVCPITRPVDSEGGSDVFSLLAEAFPESTPSLGEPDNAFALYVAKTLEELKAITGQTGVSIGQDTLRSIVTQYREGFSFVVAQFSKGGLFSPFFVAHDRLTDGRFFLPCQGATDLTLYAWGVCQRFPTSLSGESLEAHLESFEPREDVASAELFMMGDVDKDVVDIVPFGYTMAAMNKNYVSALKLKGGYQLSVDIAVMSTDELSRYSECTFKLSGKTTLFVQPLFYCYTCGIHGERGICTRCAIKCHADKGHQLVYAICESAYCDCGCLANGTNVGGAEKDDKPEPRLNLRGLMKSLFKRIRQ